MNDEFEGLPDDLDMTEIDRILEAELEKDRKEFDRVFADFARIFPYEYCLRATQMYFEFLTIYNEDDAHETALLRTLKELKELKEPLL